MSIFRRNLLKIGGGRMIDVTDRFDHVKNAVALARKDLPSPVSIEIGAGHHYEYVRIEKENGKGLTVSVGKASETTNIPFGLIAYCNKDEIVINSDAACSKDADINQVEADVYNEFVLNFPKESSHVYVNSFNGFPILIKKKLF